MVEVVAWLPLAVCVAGAILYAIAKDPYKELGRGAYWCGLLVFLFHFAGLVFRASVK